MKIGMIGTGVFSVSIANVLAQNTENEIVLWSENKELVNQFHKTKKLESIFKDLKMPKNVTVTNSYEEAIKDAELVFLMTSVFYLESVCHDISAIVDKKVPICIGTKGIANKSHLFVHEIAKKILKNPIAIMSGPTFAEDVVHLDPVGLCVASKRGIAKKKVCKAFQGLNVKIVKTIDVKGVAVCACVKNIYAIGSGIISGMGYHESTFALYLTSVYKELENILYEFNSDYPILHGLAGFGDLVLTCSSNKSRNYTYGELLGKKTSKKELQAYEKSATIEGIHTLEAINPLLKRKNMKTPVLTAIYEIVFDNKGVEVLMEAIMKKEDFFY